MTRPTAPPSQGWEPTRSRRRTAVYNRVAASFLERCLQAELLERFGAPLENFLADVWVAIDIESGCGVVFPNQFERFFEAGYQANLESLEQDHAAAMAEYQAKKRQQRAGEP